MTDPVTGVRDRGLAPGGIRRDACPLCSGTDLRLRLQVGGRGLLECNACGVRFTDEYAEGADVASYYGTVQAHHGKADSEDQFAAIARIQADAMESIAGPRRHGRLLEIGCSRGHLLTELEVRGWDVNGIDVAATSVTEARGRCRGEVWHGEPEDCPFEPGSFDRIAMFDVLAHLPHPVRTLQTVSSLLKPRGQLVLSTVDEAWPLVPVFLKAFRALPNRLAAVQDEMYEGQHYCYFSHRNIGQLLGEAGMELAATRPLTPLSAQLFVHHYPVKRRLGLLAMRRLDGLLGSSRKMLVLATRRA